MGKILNEIEFSELQTLGVPLDGDVLERKRTTSLGLHMYIFTGALETTIFDAQLGGTILIFHVVVSNNTPKAILLDECRVELPWADPDFSLLEAPWRKEPRESIYLFSRDPTLYFESDAVLNHRFGRQGRLNPGGFLDGLILGTGIQPIPDRYHNREAVDVPLTIFDGQGRIYQESARVMLDKSEQLKRQKKARERARVMDIDISDINREYTLAQVACQSPNLAVSNSV